MKKAPDFKLNAIPEEVLQGLACDETRQESYNKIWNHLYVAYAENYEWYRLKLRPNRRWAKTYRIIGIAGMAIAALWPAFQLVELAGPLVGLLGMSVEAASQFGYLAAAVGAIALAVEQFSGVSKAWIRYTKTAMVLRQSWSKLEQNWKDLRPEQEFDEKRDQLLAGGYAALWRIIADETDEWAATYVSDLKRLGSGLDKSSTQYL